MDYKEVFTRKIRLLLHESELRDKAIAIISAYGKASYEKETYRVRLAILKLAGSNLNEIQKYTTIAQQDFRDVLAWAEHPRQSEKWSMPDGPKKYKLIEADKAEYEKWLNT